MGNCAHVKKAGAWDHFVDVFLLETSLFCFYEMRTNTLTSKKSKIYTKIYYPVFDSPFLVSMYL